MNIFTNRQIEILNHLSDGACHSGNELGSALGVSRTAVWKQVKQLTEMGVSIKSLPQQGYQLSFPFKLLDASWIEDYLTQQGVFEYNLQIFATIDSTNNYLRRLPPTEDVINVCCAEMQTQGRGRFGRQWESPFGKNLYCSSRWIFNCDITDLSGLSLLVSLAVYSTLQEFVPHEETKIKWPNDVLWQDKKFCGTLIEINAESHGSAEVIIGVGINVNSSHEDMPWCSLYEIFGQYFDRNLLASRLLLKLHRYIKRFMAHGFSVFLAEWEKVDYLLGKEISVLHPSGTISGRALGVNDLGQLILKDASGKLHYLLSGETSLGSGR
jgi:BirA family biotin operon repressor/biotin-[acetyl-CoA-carboxylase] ligase